MNAKTSATESDLEYQYSEDQLTEESGPEPMGEQDLAAPKASSKFSRKKIITVIVICAMVGAIFQFLNTRDKAAEDATQAEIEQTAKAVKNEKHPVEKPVTREKLVSQPVVQQQPAVEKEVKPEVIRQATPSPLAQQLEKVTAPQLATTHQPEINELQSGLLQVNQSVDGLQKTLGSLTASVQALSHQVEQLSKQQKAKPASAPQAEVKPEVKTEYYLKAIITGRAWIESTTGDLTTVKVGDQLKGYGTITGIDPENIVITTSSGTIIRHAPNDS